MDLPTETVIIAGPTGVGKTVLALELAAKLNGEIVGADAFQLYAGLPILTAQPTQEEQRGIPHHLLGSVDPRESFDAWRYQRIAMQVIHDVAGRGHVPIVVGGTGLYLKALLGGLDELPGNDPTLREEMTALDLSALIARLQAADPGATAQIDLANRRRVERALEIVLITGRPLANSRTGGIKALPSGIRALLLTRNRDDLNERIAANVTTMFARGVEAEVAALSAGNIGPTAAMTLGLTEIRSLLQGEISCDEAITAITTATRRYAKRQMTWFRNQHAFPSLNLTSYPDSNQALEEALSLLGENCIT